VVFSRIIFNAGILVIVLRIGYILYEGTMYEGTTLFNMLQTAVRA